MCSKFLLEHFLVGARPLCKEERSRMPPFTPGVEKCSSHCVVALVPVMHSILIINTINTICGCEMPPLLHLNSPQEPSFIPLGVSALLPCLLVCCYQSSFKEFRTSSEGLHWGHGNLSEEDQFGVIFAHNPTEGTWFTKKPQSCVTNGKVKKSRDC